MALHSVSRRRQQILHARAAPKVTLALLEVMDRPLLPFISWANEGGRQREAAIAFAVVYRPRSLSIIVQRSEASQCTPLKVTHQYAFKGSDLCRMKCKLINFCLTARVLESFGNLLTVLLHGPSHPAFTPMAFLFPLPGLAAIACDPDGNN